MAGCSPVTTAYLKQGKSPGKFGPPDNPFAFGELPMMPGGSIPRFSHNVIAVNGSAMPDAWQGRLLGADPLHRHLVLSERSVRGASFTTRDIGFPVKNSDVAFRPVYMANAPDGSLLIADFYERYIAHGQHYQSQIDPTSGRVYRLRAKAKPLVADTNLSAKTDGQLIGLLAHPNKWHRQTAVRLLGHRATAVTNAKLRKQIKAETGRAALHGLWALHQAGGLDDAFAAELLGHPYPHVRSWAVRLRGDQHELSTGFGYSAAPTTSTIRLSRCNVGGCSSGTAKTTAVRCLSCSATDRFFGNRWSSGTFSSDSCAAWRPGGGRTISSAAPGC